VDPSCFLFNLALEIDWLRFHYLAKIFYSEAATMQGLDGLMRADLAFSRRFFDGIFSIFTVNIGISPAECDEAYTWVCSGSDIADVPEEMITNSCRK